MDETSRSPVFTVFTPTFNRRHSLPTVYACLLKQTFQDFEWVVVDDGSTDDTGSLVREWARVSPFPIRYVHQANGHKKTAFNRGVQLAKGELLLTADSDDEFLPDSLEIFLRHWQAIPENDRAHFAGVSCLCQYADGRPVGDRFPGDWGLDSDYLEIRYKYRVAGETWGFVRTDIVRPFRFPEDVSGYVPEGLMWSWLARQYKTRFINEPLRIYHQTSDSIMHTARQLGGACRHAEGSVVWARSVLDKELDWFRYRPWWFLKIAANYTRFNWHLATTRADKRYLLENGWARLMRILMWPVGCGLYLRDKLRR